MMEFTRAMSSERIATYVSFVAEAASVSTTPNAAVLTTAQIDLIALILFVSVARFIAHQRGACSLSVASHSRRGQRRNAGGAAISPPKPMSIAPQTVSKTAFISGHQCSKLLWFRFNEPEKIPPPSASLQAIFDQGHEVGALARRLFPDGIEIGQGITSIDEVVRATSPALRLRRPLFEAGFQYGGAYARADILVPAGSDGWDPIEVKSVTRLKDVHLLDLAFQAYVYSSAGLKLNRCFLLHLNRDYVRLGDVDPNKLFTRTDCTAQAAELSRDVEERLSALHKIIGRSTCPAVPIGPHCERPYACPLHDRCWGFLPEHNVMNLYRGRAKGFVLLKRGITRIVDVPAAHPLTQNQRLQIRAVQSGKPSVSKCTIKTFLNNLEYRAFHE